MKRWLIASAMLAALGAALFGLLYKPFPAADTAEGAYMRLARSIAEGQLETAFAYLEDDARDACYTVHSTRKEASALVAEAFPEPERSEVLARYKADADAKDGAAVFAREANERGWVTRLKKDLSGVVEVQSDGDRATIITARGTRYTFRHTREGSYGLTMFTAELVAQGNRAARDLDVVRKAAVDYGRNKPPH